jgi:hypothetical protein
MEMLHRIIGTGALLLGAIIATGCVATPPRQGDPEYPATGTIVTTGLVGLPFEHKARLALSQARPNTPEVAVEVRFKDAQGRILARERGVIGARQPVISQLFRKSVDLGGEVLVQTEILFEPVQQHPQARYLAAPVPVNGSTCPVHVVMQIVPEGDGNGPGFACGVDPCYDGGGGGGDPETQGPGHGGGVFPAFCDARIASGSDDDDE